MFSEFSKEVVNNFIEEAVNEAHPEQSAAILEKSVTTKTENKSVAIEKIQRQVVGDELVDLLVCLVIHLRKSPHLGSRKITQIIVLPFLLQRIAFLFMSS